MPQYWKEPYSEEVALAAGIHDREDAAVTGGPDAEWIYYVRVCAFTFVFFSLPMLEEYLAFYSRKVLPSSRGVSCWVGDPQTRFDRLPLYLREEPKRQRVVRALTNALARFQNEQAR